MGTIKTTFSNNIDATGKLKEGSLGFSAGTSWQSVKTSDFTAVAGEGYFVDTTSAAVEVTLPSSPSAGDYVVLKDYARTWATNNVTMASNTFDGNSNNPSFSTQGQTVTLVYMDGTKGWSLINEDTTTNLFASLITATGGTVTESGDYKIHTFTGDGCFTVSEVSPNSPGIVDYLVVAGGGSGGTACGGYGAGGGGAGGFRLSNSTCMPAPLSSPLATPTGITVSATSYPVTVGAGGAGFSSPNTSDGNVGSNSVFSTITSSGGGNGAGGPNPGGSTGGAGGSGGGAWTSGFPSPVSGGTGNSPPVSPPQGSNGGTSGVSPANGGGGGGGAGGNGTNVAPCNIGGPGGIGSYVLQTGFAGCNGTPGPVGSTRYFSGGGGGAASSGGPGGSGGGGKGGDGGTDPGIAGTTNTGGGGGGTRAGTTGAGGSGIVIIRYKYK